LGCAHELPAGFDAWFARCVDREPARRFQNATVMFEELSTLLAPTIGDGRVSNVPSTFDPQLPSSGSSSRTGPAQPISEQPRIDNAGTSVEASLEVPMKRRMPLGALLVAGAVVAAGGVFAVTRLTGGSSAGASSTAKESAGVADSSASPANARTYEELVKDGHRLT